MFVEEKTAVEEVPQRRLRVPGHGTHSSRSQAKEEQWVPTVCTMCYNSCSIQVLVRDGVATAIEGLPGAPPNYGKMCAKGKSALAGIYSPQRVTMPLRRTNPQKGLDVDPGWQEITWEEALSVVTEKLKELRARNPDGLAAGTFDWPGSTHFLRSFLAGFGGGHYGGTIPISQGLFCGNGVHPVAYMLNGSADQQPDLKYCKYLLVIGGGYGTGTGTHAMHLARELADARVKRGLKMVVVDPCQTSSGARADEWIPIVPGTDAAFCLALINVLVNDLGLYDREFLRSYTNCTYLVRPNGHYARDRATGKPLVSSISKETAVPFDEINSKDMGLEGETEVNGERVKTAFVLLREHVRHYSPEYSARITGVPAATIRRIAKEFGEAASIGSTINIDGVELPLRPASINWYRGPGQHQHGLNHGWAAAMVAMTVGAVDVPGGHCETGATGPWGLPEPGPDGLLTVTNPFIGMKNMIPPAPVEFHPDDPGLARMFPASSGGGPVGMLTLRHPQEYKSNYKLEFYIHARGNPMKSAGDPRQTAEVLGKVPFQLSFVQSHEETSQFADIVLPDTHYLERLVPFASNPYNCFVHSPAPEDEEWVFASQQPVVRPMGEARHWIEVLWELAHRAGFADDFYAALNASLQLAPQHRLEPGKVYTYEEFCDRWMKDWCGEEHGLEYFRKNGWAMAPLKREVKHRYPRVFHKGRIPFYLEHWLTAGEQIKEVVEREGIEWGDLSGYEPLVNFMPCWASQEGGNEFPLHLVSPKVGFLTLNTSTIRNPHLQELAWATGGIFNAGIHPSTAARLGVSTGDEIEIESANGRKIRTVARVTSDVHPNVVSAPGNVSRVLSPDEKEVIGQGVHLNSFLEYRKERIDMVSVALDACVKVRIRKVAGGM